MGMEQKTLDLVVLAAGLAVSGLTTLPAVVALATRSRGAKEKDAIYRDEDGDATPESVAAFSTTWRRAFVLLWAGAGLGCQIALAVIAEAGKNKFSLGSWLATAAWSLLFLQAIAIVASRDSVRAYNQGVALAAASVAIGSGLLYQLMNAASREPSETVVALHLSSCAIAFGLAIASLLIPRRPDVFHEGAQVDRGGTVSAFDRLTFRWSSQLMSVAITKGDVDMDDLPALGSQLRSADASARWNARNNKRGLFVPFMRQFAPALAKQWSLAVLYAIFGYLPWLITLRLLETIESTKYGESSSSRVWLLLIWMGIVKIIGALLESFLFWTMVTELQIPIRSQLGTLIFEKAMRRKNVKAAIAKDKEAEDNDSDGKDDSAKPDQNEDSTNSNPADADGGEPAKPGDDGGTADKKHETDQQSRQAVINLMGVDARRVANFNLMAWLIPTSIVRLVISIWFLVYLLGWIPITVAILSVSIVVPINAIVAKKFFTTSKKMMKLRDEKLELVKEVLQGIRQVKFSALESQWEKRILELRGKELQTLWSYWMIDMAFSACWMVVPILLTVSALGSYAFINGSLTASVAFTSLGILNTLDSAISLMPALFRVAVNCWVSLKRLERYLDGPEVEMISKDGPDVAFEDASIAWSLDEKDPDVKEPDNSDPGEAGDSRFVLRNVSLTFPSGELSVISGKTGAGKSLLLTAILGEADLLSGSIYVPTPPSVEERQDHKANRSNWILPNAIAYVGQIPWIENATLKDNILFGMPLDKDRYDETLAACALNKDLESLADGDETELGINGVNLSGGQKWRVTIARAVYSRAGILIMDDIFSAVDAHVGRVILERCLVGNLCKDRTRILVTHHVGLVEKHAKFIIELDNGAVLNAGLTEDLEESLILERIKSSEQPLPEADIEEAPLDGIGNTEILNGSGMAKKAEPKRKFVEDEGREKGSVSGRIYGVYLRAMGGPGYWVFLSLLYIVYQTSELAGPYVVKLWTGEGQQTSNTTSTTRWQLHDFSYHGQHRIAQTIPAVDFTATGHGTKFWLAAWAGVCVSGIIIGIFRYYFTYYASFKASRIMFQKLLFTVLRAPLRWTDTVPVGRILNRFTTDFSSIDETIADYQVHFFYVFLQAVGITVASTIASPLVVPLAVICVAWCVYVSKIYLATARPVRRIESTANSPIFDLFGSTLTGLTTIRAFGRSAPYVDAMRKKIDNFCKATMNLSLLGRWMGWNISVAGTVFAVSVVAFVLARAGNDAALAGFILNFVMDFSNLVLMVTRAYSTLELEMNAVERVVEYSEIETENLGGEKPPAAWPTQGRLEVHDLVVSYAKDLPPVLKGISFETRAAERIGVIGRTGAGKSSLTLALFRFLEAQSGTIHVDGLDISKLKLEDLRSRLAIIPQDPVLFSGTIRSNLDPFDSHTDEELHDCLRRVHLVSDSDSETNTVAAQNGSPPPEPANLNVPESSLSVPQASIPPSRASTPGPRNINVFRDLASPVSEGGQNLSQGQRQLLCLARAIVARPKIMVLDEATSAVDMATDTLIQRSIREEFGGSTLIVIAHRLSTIADFDRILVLSDGQIAEYGTPKELWDIGTNGVFRGMCEESGEKEKLRLVVTGEVSSGP
ncbi:ABC transporter [Immersiella caudata]|uniref:ABC transporter n=1 Tax=Immersiella caudata TaxID=314043 RepID=A0AA39TRZ9_9PEZI|nr:ABC transporter [Immersiella caudata]